VNRGDNGEDYEVGREGVAAEIRTAKPGC